MHNQISRKRQQEPCLDIGAGRFRVYPVDVAGVNAETLKYESWTEYAVYERKTDDFGAEHWQACDVPEWASLIVAELVRSGSPT